MTHTNAFLVLVTWPDSTEGLLFPRPGNVAIADTTAKGMADFDTAKEHLLQYAKATKKDMTGTTIRLVPFLRLESPLAEFTL